MDAGDPTLWYRATPSHHGCCPVELPFDGNDAAELKLRELRLANTRRA